MGLLFRNILRIYAAKTIKKIIRIPFVLPWKNDDIFVILFGKEINRCESDMSIISMDDSLHYV